VSDYKNIHYAFDGRVSDFQKFQIISSQPFAYLFYQMGKLVLHGSAIEIKGRAFLFIGVSNSGKSFFASNLLSDSKLITEDICVIDSFDDNFYIRPSIPVIKIDNPDIVNNKNIKSKHKLIDKRNRKAIVLNNSKFSSQAIKIEACFVLNFSEKFEISKINFNKSFASILLSSFQSNPILSSKNHDSDIHKKIGDFLNIVPLFNIERNKRFNDFDLVSNFIHKTFFNE
jgi:GTPase SAR1 family protein